MTTSTSERGGQTKKKREVFNNLQEKNLISWFRDAEKPQQLRLTASIHTKEQWMVDVTDLQWGINKQCHKGAWLNASLDGDIIDGALIRIRLLDLRQTPWLHGFCQSAVTTMERLRTVLKTKHPPQTNPYSLKISSCPCSFCSCTSIKSFTSLFVLFTH